MFIGKIIGWQLPYHHHQKKGPWIMGKQRWVLPGCVCQLIKSNLGIWLAGQYGEARQMFVAVFGGYFRRASHWGSLLLRRWTVEVNQADWGWNSWDFSSFSFFVRTAFEHCCGLVRRFLFFSKMGLLGALSAGREDQFGNDRIWIRMNWVWPWCCPKEGRAGGSLYFIC